MYGDRYGLNDEIQVTGNSCEGRQEQRGYQIHQHLQSAGETSQARFQHRRQRKRSPLGTDAAAGRRSACRNRMVQAQEKDLISNDRIHN